MKKLMVIVLLLISIPAWSGTAYNVTVTRSGQDTYKTDTGNLILTQYCYEYAYSQSATLIWDYPVGQEHPHGGKLIFHEGGTSCDVKAVY